MAEIFFYTLIEYANYFLAYRCVFGVRFTKKKWPYAVIFVLTCALEAVYMRYPDDIRRDNIVMAMGVFAALLLTKCKKWKALLLYPVVFFFSSIVNILIGGYGMGMLFHLSTYEIGHIWQLTCIGELPGIILFSAYYVFIKKKEQDEFTLTKMQYFILLAGTICVFLVVAFAQGIAWELPKTDVIKEYFLLASLLLALFFLLLFFWQQSAQKKIMQYQMEQKEYELFLKGQEQHIKELIVDDERRRRLRHDMNAHMLAMETMIEGEDWKALREYFDHMRGSLELNAVNRFTGISAVDAIVEEWYEKALENHIEWSWKGTLETLGEKLSVFDWCVIFSNLLSNAVEAAQKEENGKIEIYVQIQQDCVAITVGNTCAPQESGKNLKTSKGDELLHGLGLKNVEEIVKKYDGQWKTKAQDGWFEAEIVF